ncbi:MAG TPA: PH domain-containing protein [Rhodothermales bacterium]
MNVAERSIESFRESQRLHPMTLLQRLIVSLPGLLILVLTARNDEGPQQWLYLLALGLYGFIAIPMMVLYYLRFRFRISSTDLLIDSGVVTRRRRSIPIERIQNVEIQRPLLARLSGTAKVRVETAGSAGAEGVLELISLETAYRLRDAIRAFQRELKAEDSRASNTAGDVVIGEEAEAQRLAITEASVSGVAPASERLYEMGLGRVLLSGVFRFSLIYIAVMFSGMEYLNVDPVDIFDWVERGPLRPFAEFAATSPTIAILASLAAASAVAWVTGILVNLNRFYRFRLQIDQDKLLYQHGLLTLQEAAIPLKRVQTFVLRTNPLMRRYGWWALDVQTLGLESSRRGRSIIVPFARLEEVLAVLGRLEAVAVPESYLSVSRLTIRRRFLRYSIVLAAASGLVWLIWSPAAWALTGVPVLLAVAFAQYRNHGYVPESEHLFVRSGVLRHQVWVIPTRKHQAFFETESFFQRRLGLASLHVDTAGAPSWRFPQVVDLPVEVCRTQFDALVARIRDGRNRDSSGTLSTAFPEPPLATT